MDPVPAGRRTRVAMPLLTLVPGGMGGSETYVRQLTRELADHDDLEVRTTVPASAVGSSGGLPERVLPQVRGGEAAVARVLTQLQAAALTPAGRHRVLDADVVHFPLSVPAPPPPRGVPWVQTLLDVQHHDLRTLFSRAELAYRSVLYDRPARRCDAVITISEFSRRRIVSHLGVSPDRVHVAHLGVDTTDFTPQLGPRDDFVLYPARGWPHKNHVRLVEAMFLLRESRPGLRLVLTGGALEQLGDLPPWVDRRGLVSREELLSLYRSAACLAFPSLYEGFGLPPLEAMASGCPVAAADAGSLPEICGDAAVLFDPHDARATSVAIGRAIDDRGRLARQGLEQARRFTWSACARVHADLYRGLAGSRESRRRSQR